MCKSSNIGTSMDGCAVRCVGDEEVQYSFVEEYMMEKLLLLLLLLLLNGTAQTQQANEPPPQTIYIIPHFHILFYCYKEGD